MYGKMEISVLNTQIENPPQFDQIVLGDVKIPDVNKKDNKLMIKK